MRRFHRLQAVLPALLVGSLMVSCGDDDDDDDDDRRDTGVQLPDAGDGGTIRSDAGDAAAPMDSSIDARTDATTSDAGALTDNQISAIMQTINTGEIQAGTLASTKGTNASVKGFAMSMVSMHMAAETRRAALNLQPMQSDISTGLMAQAATVMQNLTNAPMGATFDIMYMESQVMMHRMALDLIDGTLLRQAMAQALRNELMTARAEVNMHLTMAMQIRATLSDAGVGDAGRDGGTTDAGGMDSGG